MNELELSIRCSQGDQDAYRELYETYAKLLMGVCLRYTGNVDIANDLLHDGFVKIFTSIKTFRYRDAGSLRAWITRVMVNTVLEYLRKKKMLNYVDDLERLDEVDNDTGESEIHSIPEEVIFRFITELPVVTRSVFNLYTFEDMTHAEIGEALGIKETASRMRLSRARKELSEKMNYYVNS